MTSFDARLRLVGQPGLPLGVVVDLTGKQMSVNVDGRELASWSLEEIEIAQNSDGFHIEVEGEEVILNVNEKVRFATELRSRSRRPPG
ncbi:MAG: hypothetical protein WEB67_08695 [Acidimicrobiia bacterium]